MRSNEEFKALVYGKRDRILAEEKSNKIKFNKNMRAFGIVSSAAAACLVTALILPNISTILDAPSFDPEAPLPEINETSGIQMEDGSEAGTHHDNPEMDEISPPTENPPPESSGGITVRYTQVVSTNPIGTGLATEREVGYLVGSLGVEYVVINNYESLNNIFSRLCDNISVDDAFEPDLFSKGCFVLAIERTGKHPKENNVTYSRVSFNGGILSLRRDYSSGILSSESALNPPASEMSFVDFAVIYAPGIDPDSIININVE